MIRVLFFGAVAELAGKREVEIAGAVTVSDVFAKTVEHFPVLAKRKLLVALNETYATGGETVCDGDEVAIFTPVSGG